MIINKALLKYGYSEFKLEILEYCDPNDIVNREQYYIDTFTPAYNILKTAYSSQGYKHSKEALEKINKNLSILNKSKSISVKVTNLETNEFQEYSSITEAAKNLGTSKYTLKKYILNSKNFKGIYKLESNLTISNFNSNYLNHPSSIKIEVIDLELNTTTLFDSIRSAERALGLAANSISIVLRRNQTSPYKNRFLFKKTLLN